MTKKVLTLTLAIFGSLVFASVAKAEAIIIDSDTTWIGEVVVDNGEGVVITNGATLTIAPEAVVKMGTDNSIILAGGNLALSGEADKPAIITALTVSSTPSDWGYILASSPNSNISMNYAVVEFGGGGNLSIPSFIMIQQAQSVTIENSSLLNNNGSILVYEIGNFIIHNTNIYNPDFCQDLGGDMFCGSSIFNFSETEIDATDNYWGSDLGPTTDPTGDIYGTVIQGNISYIPFLTSAWEPVIDDGGDDDDDDDDDCLCKKHWWLGCKNHKHHFYKPMKGPWGQVKKVKVVFPVSYHNCFKKPISKPCFGFGLKNSNKKK